MEYQPNLWSDTAGCVNDRKQLPYPLRLLVIGASHTGKTFLIRKMILRGDLGPKSSLSVAVFSPVTASLRQPIWSDLQSRGYGVKGFDALDAACDALKRSRRGRKVLIIDDVDNLATAGKRLQDRVTKLFTVESHHSDISVIMISHQLKTGSPAARDSADFIILTANPSGAIKDLIKQLDLPNDGSIERHLLGNATPDRDGWPRCFNHVLLVRLPGCEGLWNVDESLFTPPGVTRLV